MPSLPRSARRCIFKPLDPELDSRSMVLPSRRGCRRRRGARDGAYKPSGPRARLTISEDTVAAEVRETVHFKPPDPELNSRSLVSPSHRGYRRRRGARDGAFKPSGPRAQLPISDDAVAAGVCETRTSAVAPLSTPAHAIGASKPHGCRSPSSTQSPGCAIGASKPHGTWAVASLPSSAHAIGASKPHGCRTLPSHTEPLL